MTKPLDFQAERFSALGNIGGRGIAKILGTPKHDRLQVLVRETVQNSWDAAASTKSPVTYRLNLRSLTQHQRSYLTTKVFAVSSLSSGDGELSESLQRDSLRVIEVSDLGTTGLGGPTNADDLNDAGEATDFVDFIRNIGSLRDKEHGGGTYGYGKASLYLASRCATILVHTVCNYRGKRQERLIGCRLGDPLTVRSGRNRGKYTGRYWWGQIKKDVIQPVTGARARAIAKGLGMPSRGAADFGTTILILDPVTENRSSVQAVNAVQEILLWTYWPKIVSVGDTPASMRFEIALDNEPMQLLAPEEYPPLNIYVEAMRLMKHGRKTHDIRCDRPSKNLGRLALTKYPIEKRVFLDTGSRSSLTLERSHHVALMRPAELVVKYLPGPELQSNKVEYGGVFICDEGVEQAFATAEPPAHDDWIYQNLERPAKTYVRQAVLRVKDKMAEFSGARKTTAVQEGSSVPLGPAGDTLGGLLLGQPGPRIGGNSKQRKPGKKTGKKKPARSFRLSQPEFIGFSGATRRQTAAAMFRMSISGSGTLEGRIVATPAVQLEGGATTAEPSGVKQPEVVLWSDGKGNRLSRGNNLSVKIECPAALIAFVSVPEDCALSLDVRLETSR
ncbi:MAG: hypothetical protein AAGJ55_00155 [Cyanobacteria bacterium J06555_12]